MNIEMVYGQFSHVCKYTVKLNKGPLTPRTTTMAKRYSSKYKRIERQTKKLQNKLNKIIHWCER